MTLLLAIPDGALALGMGTVLALGAAADARPASPHAFGDVAADVDGTPEELARLAAAVRSEES